MEKKFTVLPMGESIKFEQREVVYVCKCKFKGEKCKCTVKSSGRIKKLNCPLGLPDDFVKFEVDRKYGDFLVEGDTKQ